MYLRRSAIHRALCKTRLIVQFNTQKRISRSMP